MQENKLAVLNGNHLKLIAAVTMLLDHAGILLFPKIMLFRILGRLAYPIYAYMIAEGCRYTRNKRKRFLLVLGLAVLCEGVYYFMSGEPDGGILVNFSISILLVYQVQACKKALARRRWWAVILWLLLFAASVAGVYYLVREVLYVDYGFWGILIPVWAVIPDYKEGEAPEFFKCFGGLWWKLLFFSVGLLILCASRGLLENIQSFSLFALPLLTLYNGTPGRKGLKYGFYIFYPAHLVVLWIIAAILQFR